MNELSAKQFDVLMKILEIQIDHAKSRLDIQFRTFTWWAALLFGGIGVVLLQRQHLSAANLPQWLIAIVAVVVLLLPLMPGFHIIWQARYYRDNMRVAERIESCFGLFEVGIFLEKESILPLRWRRRLHSEKPRRREAWVSWLYAGILQVLGFVLALLIVLLMLL